MKIKLTIEMIPTRTKNHTYIPDEFVADEHERKLLTLLGLTGYVRELVKRKRAGIGSLDFSVSVTGPFKKE